MRNHGSRNSRPILYRIVQIAQESLRTRGGSGIDDGAFAARRDGSGRCGGVAGAVELVSVEGVM